MNHTKRLLAEWETQDAVMLTWPHPNSDWAKMLDDIESVYQKIVQHISRFERVLLLCYDESTRERAKRLLNDKNTDIDQVIFMICQTNDVWARDYGPISLHEQDRPILLDFSFNGWGTKYAFDKDNAVNTTLNKKNIFTPDSYQAIDFILEGGSIETDGAGVFLSTRSCLLNPNRQHCDETDVEKFLTDKFTIQHFLWLEHGSLEGDDTDGHIDTLARFCNTKTICYASCNDEKDEHFDVLKKMANELKQFRTLSGETYQLIPLPIPKAIYNQDKQRLPATYANFLIINDAVLLPIYNDPNDQVAIEQLTHCFPDRTIIPIDANPIIQQFGSLHCLTMQLTKGSLYRENK